MGAKREEEINPSYKKVSALILKYNKGDYMKTSDLEAMIIWGKNFVEQMELELKLSNMKE